MADKIVMQADTRMHLVEIGGKKYRVKNMTMKKGGHRDKIIFVPSDEEAYSARLKKVASSLTEQTSMDANTILIDILGQMPIDQFRRIERKLEQKVKPEVEHGCLDIRIGGELIPIC